MQHDLVLEWATLLKDCMTKMCVEDLIKTREKRKRINSQYMVFAGPIRLWCSNSGRLEAFREVNSVASLFQV